MCLDYRSQLSRCASLLGFLLQATPLQPGLKRKMGESCFMLAKLLSLLRQVRFG